MKTMRWSPTAASGALLVLAACAAADDAVDARGVAGNGTAGASTTQTPGQGLDWGALEGSDGTGGSEYDVRYVTKGEGMPTPFARIDRAGAMRRIHPATAIAVGTHAQTVADRFVAGCRDDGMHVEGGDALIDNLILQAVRKDDGARFELSALSSRAYAEWLAGSREAFDSGDATLDLHVAAGAARVRGMCRLHSGDVIDYDLDLKPGLNLVRTRYDRFSNVGREPDSPAAKLEAGVTTRSVEAFPEDMRWFLQVPRHHSLQAEAWGRLDRSDDAAGSVLDVRVAGMGDETPLLGRIDAQGIFRPVAAFALPEMPDWSGTLEGLIGVEGRCIHDHGRTSMAYDNPEARVIELSPYAVQPGPGTELLLLASNSPDYVRSLLDPAQRFTPGAAIVHVYFAVEATGMRGSCPGELEGSSIAFDIRLQPGLNLIREEFLSFRDSGGDGDSGYGAWAEDLQMRIASAPTFPADVRWFTLSHHGTVPPVDESPAEARAEDWGRLENDGLEATRLRIHANELLDGDQLGPDIPLGEVGPDGVFLSAGPASPAIGNARPVAEFFCAGATIDNPSARVAEFTLRATAADGSRWQMVGADSPEFARWRGGEGGKVWTGDQEMRVYHVSEAVQVHGACGGVFHHLNLSPGWNPVVARVSGMEGFEGDGDPWPAGWSLTRHYNGQPPEMRWYLFPDLRGVE